MCLFLKHALESAGPESVRGVMKRNGNAAAIRIPIVAVATFLAVQSKTVSAKSGNQRSRNCK